MTNANAKSSLSGNRWLNLRRMLLWALVIVLLSTLVVIFLMPTGVKDFTVKVIKAATGRDATIAEVGFDPMAFSVRVKGFDLSDTAGETLLSMDELVVKPQISTLFSKRLTFREIQLHGGYVFFERFSPDDDSLSQFLADIERYKVVHAYGNNWPRHPPARVLHSLA